MSQWYYVREGQQKGPISLEELCSRIRAGEVGSENLVWNLSMKDWLPAAQVGELSESFTGPAVAAPPVDSSNPYASPASTWVGGISALPAAGPPLEEIVPGSDPIDGLACVKRGFELTKRNFGVIALTGLCYFGVTMVAEIPFGIIEVMTASGSPQVEDLETPVSYSAAYEGIQVTTMGLIHRLVSTVVSLFLSMGVTRIWLNLVSGKEASVGQLFGEGDKFLKLIGASILFYLMLIPALLLLIAPGIYVALRFGQYQNAIVDKDLGVIDAFKYSSSITTGNRGNLLLLFIVGFAVMIAGLLALCVGVLFAIPVVALSTTVAYRWMQYGRRASQDHPGTTVPLLRGGN